MWKQLIDMFCMPRGVYAKYFWDVFQINNLKKAKCVMLLSSSLVSYLYDMQGRTIYLV